MALNNYFEEYISFVDGLQNRIMNIQLKYNECQGWVVTDYRNGVISKELYDRLFDMRMDEFIQGVDSKYVLSKEDVDILNKYAALDSAGRVLANILDSKYLKKRDTLQSILKSVKTFAYYKGLDDSTRRVLFRDIVVKYYEKENDVNLSNLAKLESVYGEKAKEHEQYRKVSDRLDFISKALDYTQNIVTLSEEQLISLMERFFKIDYHYYEWYRRMQLKEEFDKGFVYGEHLDMMHAIVADSSKEAKLQLDFRQNSKDAFVVSKTLSAFLEGIIEFDLNGFEDKGVLRLFNRNKDNKRCLLEVFRKLCLLPGVLDYIRYSLLDLYDNDEIDVEVAFEEYYNSSYGGVEESPAVMEFVNRFRRDVTSYYKRLISQYEKAVSIHESQVDSVNTRLISNSKKGLNQAELIRDIYLGYNCEDVMLDGFTDDELERIYNSLKEYIVNGFELETGDFGTPKKKV